MFRTVAREAHRRIIGVLRLLYGCFIAVLRPFYGRFTAVGGAWHTFCVQLTRCAVGLHLGDTDPCAGGGGLVGAARRPYACG